jgi:uncharacterized membrane protein
MGTRRITALALIAVPFVVMLVVLLTVKDLPDPLPSHWNGHGDVNGTMSHPAFTVMALVVTLGALLVAIGFTRAHEDAYRTGHPTPRCRGSSSRRASGRRT